LSQVEASCAAEERLLLISHRGAAGGPIDGPHHESDQKKWCAKGVPTSPAAPMEVHLARSTQKPAQNAVIASIEPWNKDLARHHQYFSEQKDPSK
jgi:hypothetical protein